MDHNLCSKSQAGIKSALVGPNSFQTSPTRWCWYVVASSQDFCSWAGWGWPSSSCTHLFIPRSVSTDRGTCSTRARNQLHLTSWPLRWLFVSWSKKYLMLSVMRNVKRGTRIVCLRLVRIGYQNIHQVDHDSVLTQSSIAGLIVLASSSILKATPHKIFMFTHRLINDVLKTWHAPSCDAIC